jgi:hypothetical protein
MKRHIVMLVSAGAIIVGLSSPVLAQTPQTSDPNAPAKTAVQPSTNAAPPSGPRAGMSAEKKAQRVAARGDCRAQGKQQSLTHDALRNYVKSCLAAH